MLICQRQPRICVSLFPVTVHTEGSHTAQAASAVGEEPSAGLPRRDGATWILGREGQATTENTTNGPILRPLSPGLSCAGCQPSITLSANETLLVPFTPSLLCRAGPEPRHRWAQPSRGYSYGPIPALQTYLHTDIHMHTHAAHTPVQC